MNVGNISPLINISGRQRMLSQRICFLALLTLKNTDQKEDIIKKMQKSLELFESSHQVLINGDPDKNLSGLFSNELERVFYGEKINANHMVTDFIRRTWIFLEEIKNNKEITYKNLDVMLDMSSGKLLETLNIITNTYENEVKKITIAMNTQIEQSQYDLTELLRSIKSIAQRTEFISINAQISAARAGPQGAEFEVVADEILGLSGKINNLIGEAIQKMGGEKSQKNEQEYESSATIQHQP